MDIALIVNLVKERLGIRSAVRDSYLRAIVESVVKELQSQQGIILVPADHSHLLFCVDYATWRYQSRDESGAMPRHLQFRFHNLILSAGGQPP